MSVVSFKCPNCGGGLSFDPKAGFRCEYCLSVFTREELDERYGARPKEEEAQPKPKTENGEEEPMLYSCPSCGAEIITTATTAATSCHYCHNPIVLSQSLAGSFKPDKVIPFVVTKDKAREMFKQHCTGKRFLPKDFYSESQIENLYGVYYPYWVVDTQLEGTFTATGEIEKRTRSNNDLVVDTEIYSLHREGSITLNDMTNAALKSADELILKYILPFELKDSTDFSMAYLSGFRAEKRDMEREDLMDKVEQQKREYSERLLSNGSEKYTSVSDKNLSLQTISETWEYVLLPVWILMYKYNDKSYIYGINGQSGKSYGELPVDKNRLLGASILVFAALCAIIFLIWGFM